MNTVIHAENLEWMRAYEGERFRVIYMDPPFNTGSERVLRPGGAYHYADSFTDYAGFLLPRIAAARELLTDDGTMYVHVGTNEAHHVRAMMDQVFGRESFINEIIWAYDYGGRSKRKWPAKHQNIYMYSKTKDGYVFNREEVDRIPYMAPGLAGAEKAARGKFPTDVWWHTIVSPTSKERTGYPDQKPVPLIERMILASSLKGDLVLDPFCGSGTTGVAAAKNGRRYILVDESIDAVEVSRRRLF